MPWKWMAIETLRDLKFSIKSDIWSYVRYTFVFHYSITTINSHIICLNGIDEIQGVLIWELFTLVHL